MEKRRLPAGIQTFRRIREEGYYYVDKTAYALRIARSAGAHYFLSRPRRFGKSLFVDTLKELYEGSEPLFRGLAVHDVWNWSKRHPVVRLDFAGGNFKRPGELHASVMRQLAATGRRSGLPASDVSTPANRFADLLEALHERTGERVVVLVDEYDKPILDARDEAGTSATGGRGGTIADNAQAKANRDDLRGLYGTLKACDAHVELTFITGVSKFAKVSLFSDLNFLTDLTLDRHCAAICGYTETDLDTVFAPELPGLDRDQIRGWYNGYNWRGEEKVYNPYGILQFFAGREFKAYWFETATPRFLIDTLIERDFPAPDLETLRADDDLLSAFDVDTVATEALLFQTGYLTITNETKDADGVPEYRLGYPNREVRRGLNRGLLDALAPNWRSGGNGIALRCLLAAEDWDGLEALFRKLLAGIPHDWHRRNDVARYEGYWSSVFYAFFQASMDGVTVEDATSRGRIDMAVVAGDKAYLFEFKVAEQTAHSARPGSASGNPSPADGAALAQLKARRYADKYRGPDRAVHLIGVEISADTRDVTAFDVEPA